LRSVRSYLPATATVVVVGAATLFVAGLDPRRGTNLAPTAVVSTSSRYPDMPAVGGTVDGDLSKIGFHTLTEDSPWVLLDLRRERAISRVVVHNRVDCCGGRAVPLVVELSRDGVAFTTVARSDRVFDVWDQPLVPTTARYVRLRLLRREMLHLSEVEVY
jgi:hypothetical protein